MGLRHLRYFVVVAEELHLGRGAERLHVSQPPLSQQIGLLEEEVEVRLFDRNKRWVRLTGAGRQFLEHARQVLAQADGAMLAARRTVGGEWDRLSVACAPLQQTPSPDPAGVSSARPAEAGPSAAVVGFRAYCAGAAVRGVVDDTVSNV
jgi:DNA-binding transcriptional LysR family regulator